MIFCTQQVMFLKKSSPIYLILSHIFYKFLIIEWYSALCQPSYHTGTLQNPLKRAIVPQYADDSRLMDSTYGITSARHPDALAVLV